MPKPWEEEETFGDALYEWMQKGPWLALSAILHLAAFLIVANIPWSIFEQSKQQNVQASIEQAPEPRDRGAGGARGGDRRGDRAGAHRRGLRGLRPQRDGHQRGVRAVRGRPDDGLGLSFDKNNSNSLLGIGGGAGGKYGGRFGGKRNLRTGGGKGTEQAIKDGLEWLKKHQDKDGKWDCAEFMKHDPPGDKCDGGGDAIHDIGATGLALLAFLGDGHTMTRGTYKDVVKRGIKWLVQEQDRESGLFGDGVGKHYLYDHSIATLAMCETFYLDKSTLLKTKAQKAMTFISRARNPYGVWRYDVPPTAITTPR